MAETDTKFPLSDDLNGYVSTIRRTTRGYEGVRYARVFATDEASAIIAPGLPAIGDTWPNLPGCIVQELGEPVRFGGRIDESGSQFWIIPVRYQTPRPTALAATRYRVPGEAITEYFNNSENITIFSPVGGIPAGRAKLDANGNPTADPVVDTPTNNGDGASVPFMKLGARVHVWYDPNQPPDMGLFARLGQPAAVNNAPVSLPPRDYSIVRQNFNAYEVLYAGFAESIELSGRPGLDGTPKALLRVTHTLMLAGTHDVVWGSVDERGAPTGDKYADIVSAETDFTGLWP